MKQISVVAGIIYYKNEILCVQRAINKFDYISKKFEFPGGKIEEGETREDALRREIMEELEMEVEVKELFLTVTHPYPDFELTMHSYICEVAYRQLTLHEHIDYKWLTLKNLKDLDWAAADIPIVNKLVANG